MNRDFDLPTPDANDFERILPREIREEIDHDLDTLQEIDTTNRAKLNAEQRALYDTIVTSIENEKGLLISLDASGGRGKTFVLTTILAQVQSKKEVVLATPTSVIVATPLRKGRTPHSRLKVPINITDDRKCDSTL